MDPKSDHIPDWIRTSGRSPALIADPILQALAAILLVSLFFLTFPGIDPWFSSLFFDPKTGFPMDRLAAFTALRVAGDWAVKGTVIVLIGSMALKLARPERPTPLPPNHVVYLLSSLVLGPGLLVNVIFKENWGRPRPAATALFGGDTPFVPIWRVTDHCLGNCSFVSGEASAAIWLVAAAILLPMAWRPRARLVLVVFAILLSLNRIAFGRHFLSDVLMAWALTLLVIAVMHRLIVESPPTWLRNDVLEDGLTRLGRRLRPSNHTPPDQPGPDDRA